MDQDRAIDRDVRFLRCRMQRRQLHPCMLVCERERKREKEVRGENCKFFATATAVLQAPSLCMCDCVCVCVLVTERRVGKRVKEENISFL